MSKKGTSKTIRAFIFAEGGDPRLRPLTDHLPTSLVPVGGTPLLDRQIQALLHLGITDITVVGGYRAAQVEQACRPYSAVAFRYNPRFSRSEPGLSALRACGPMGQDPVLFLRGDLLPGEEALRSVLEGTKSAHLVSKEIPVGLYRLTTSLAKSFHEAGEALLAEGDSDRELFAFLDEHVAREGSRQVSVTGAFCARLDSMEALARALKAHPEVLSAGGRILVPSRGRERIRNGGDRIRSACPCPSGSDGRSYQRGIFASSHAQGLSQVRLLERGEPALVGGRGNLVFLGVSW